MPMRRSIGISLAFLMASTCAIAKTPEKNSSHGPAQLYGVKSGKGEHRTGKIRVLSCKSAHPRSAGSGGRGRHRYAASDSVATASGGPPDAYLGPVHPIGRGEIGTAAWYNRVGAQTSSGEILDTVTATAAHRSLPLASLAKVTSLDSGRSVIVKINDRGPWTRRFIIDLSPRAADELDVKRTGVAAVIVEPVAAGPAAPIDAAESASAQPSGLSLRQ
jgi:rare lipoprotein A (peptidoglycan hydrolase)